MRHHILLPTDFSDNAWSAALYAMNLYANKSCTFYFSHTWTFLNTGSRSYISPSYIEPLKEQAKEKLAASKDRAEVESKDKDRDHQFETIFTEGELIDTVKFATKEYKMDIVVMGTKGATGAQKILLGSNAVTIIKKLKRCPLMLVPNNCDFTTPIQIAFPTDFNRVYGNELLPLKHLADLHNSTINILQISDTEDLTEKQIANKEMLETNLENYNYNFKSVLPLGNKEQTIKAFNDENGINILTMINYKHSFIENITKEPLIKKLGFQSKIPFLVIPRIK